MTLKEFKEKTSQGKVSMGSQLAMRNENIQERKRVNQYTKLKREKSKVCRLLVPKEIALDFDPMTGSVTDEFNADRKFRPLMAPSELALILKEIADSVPETKERLMSRSGVEEWDTSNFSELTEVDKAVFRPYLYPVIYTIPVFNTTLKTMSRNSYGASFIIKVDRDPITNRVIGETPLPLQANYFFRAVAQEEISELKSRVEKGEEDLTDKQLTDKIRQINDARVLVSSEFPSNWVRVIEVPLNPTDMSIDPSFKVGTVTNESMPDFVRLSRYTSELRETILKFRTGAWKNKDVNFDFYEFDMVCPTTGDKPADVGRATRYEKPEMSISEQEGFAKFIDVYREAFGKDEYAEQTVLTSTYFKNYDSSVEKKLLEALSLEIDLANRYVTEEVLISNQEFITTVFGEQGDEILLQAEMGISGKSKGNFNPAKAEEPTYDLNEMTSFDDVDLDMDEITE